MDIEVVNKILLLSKIKEKYMKLTIIKALFNLKNISIFMLAFLLDVGYSFAQTAPAVAAAVEEKAPKRYDLLGYYLLLAAGIFLVLIVLGKALRLLGLNYNIGGKKLDFKWNKINAILCLVFLVVFCYGSYWCFDVLGDMSIKESASEHGAVVDNLFNITAYITGFVFFATHILLFGYAFLYQQKKEKRAFFYPHNNKLEIYWTLIPAVVLTVLVIFGWRTWTDITSAGRHSRNPIPIEIVGEQFRWTVRYAGADGMLGDRNYKLINAVNNIGLDFKDGRNADDMIVQEIVMPVNKPIKFTMGAKDVLHSVYMPDFRLQMNCVPGMPTYFYFTPTLTTKEMRRKTDNPKYDYVLLCAKICGAAHYNMQVKVRVVSEAEYNTWFKKQKPFYTNEVKKELQAIELEKKKEVKSNELALK